MTNGRIVTDSVKDHLWRRAALIGPNSPKTCCRQYMHPCMHTSHLKEPVCVLACMWVCVLKHIRAYMHPNRARVCKSCLQVDREVLPLRVCAYKKCVWGSVRSITPYISLWDTVSLHSWVEALIRTSGSVNIRAWKRGYTMNTQASMYLHSCMLG